MRILEKKAMSTAIALFLIPSVAVAMFPLPTSNEAGTTKTYPFIDAIPNPVGVNQSTLLNIGLLNFLYAENDGWNVTVTITQPDNHTETLGPFKTFSTGTYGKIYIGHMEHSALDPKPRGAPFFALNATTGELVWKIDGAFRQSRWGGRAIIGDSIIATQDRTDQKVYAIGKGPSATSVTAPQAAAVQGESLVITGTITDVSPGTKDDALTLRFPSGVPAVSDESMSNWMLYVHKQFAKPTNVTGVKVKLTAVDSNMNTIDIGTATATHTGLTV